MDRLQKFLAKLNPNKRERVIVVIERLGVGDIKGLNISALKGFPGHFRVRIGAIRILCCRQGESFLVYDAGYRGGIYK